ncbi:hypothetical protein DITRI_Ditri14bG0116600 [Diplodiscus trichospermus]
MAKSAYQKTNNVSPKTCLDRISQLPDVLIQHILSFLPTKEAVATSILSKRWLWVWISVPILDLEDSPCCTTDEKLRFDFVQFVTDVLILNKVSFLDKFCIKLNSFYHPFYARTWFMAAVTRDVKELDITIHGMGNSHFLKLPRSLFTAKTLTILKLKHGVELDVPATVYLPCLKVLHLVWIKFTNDESLSRLFSACPVLQELLLQKFDSDNALKFNISIPTLKSLSLSFSGWHGKHKLKINTPVLEYLVLQDNLCLEYEFDDISSLLEANVTVSLLENRHIQLIKALRNAKFISFHWDWYSAMTRRNFKTYPLFHNLVQLELNVGYGGWSVLSRFLESSHNLEILVLVKNANCRGLGLECCWTPPKHVPKCFLSCLKMVYFRGFEGLTYQLSMVKYILNNARVLKMVDICTNGISDMPLDSKFDMLKKLSMFPRSCKTCQLQFN